MCDLPILYQWSLLSHTCGNSILSAVKYVACLEDGTIISKSDGIEYTVREGKFHTSSSNL